MTKPSLYQHLYNFDIKIPKINDRIIFKPEKLSN